MEKIKENLSEKEFKRFYSTFECSVLILKWNLSLGAQFDTIDERAEKIIAAYGLMIKKVEQNPLTNEDNEVIFGNKLMQLIKDMNAASSAFDKFTDDFRTFLKDAGKIIKALKSKTKKADTLMYLEEYEKITAAINQTHLVVKEQFEKNEINLKKTEATLKRNVN